MKLSNNGATPQSHTAAHAAQPCPHPHPSPSTRINNHAHAHPHAAAHDCTTMPTRTPVLAHIPARFKPVRVRMNLILIITK